VSWVTRVAVEEWDRPQRDEDIRREEEEHDKEKLAVECGKLSEECEISTSRQALTRPFGTLTKSTEGSQCWRRMSSTWANLGVVRAAHIIDLPNLVPHEKHAILSTTWGRVRDHQKQGPRERTRIYR